MAKQKRKKHEALVAELIASIKKSGLTQEQLEKASGVSQGAISNIVTKDRSDPRISSMVSLFDAVDYDLIAVKRKPKQ